MKLVSVAEVFWGALFVTGVLIAILTAHGASFIQGAACMICLVNLIDAHRERKAARP